MIPIRSQFYTNLEVDSQSFNTLFNDIFKDNPPEDQFIVNNDDPIILTRGHLTRLICCITNHLNTLMWHEEERLTKVLEKI